MKRCAKIFAVVFLVFVSVASVIRLCFCFWSGFFESENKPDKVDEWLEKHHLVPFKDCFVNKGESVLLIKFRSDRSALKIFIWVKN